MKFKSTTVFILIMLCFYFTYAQHFEWSKSYGGGGGDNGRRVVIDDSLNNYMVGTCSTPIQFDTINLPSSNSFNYSLFLVKHDSNGNIIYLSTMESNDVIVSSAYYNKNNHTILIGGETRSSLVVNNAYIVTASPLGKANSFISVFDAGTGKHLWTKIVNSSSSMSSTQVISDDSGFCYLMSTFHYSAQVAGQSSFVSSSASTQSSVFIAKFDKASNFIWQKNLIDNVTISNVDFKNNKLYLIGNIEETAYAGNKVLNSIPSNGVNAIILITDTTGQTLDGFVSATHTNSYGWCIKSFNHSIYIAGNYFAGTSSTPTFGNKVINNSGNGIYLAKYNEDGNCIWVKSTSYFHNTINSTSGQAFDLNYNKSGNIYITGTQTNLKFNNTTPSNLPIFISKFDSLGNYLWTFFTGEQNGFVHGWSIAVDTLKNAYVCGSYFSAIQLGADTFSAYGSYGVFLTKIQDVTITRSQTMPKKYCAGDSVFVPYSISGQFTPGNHFTAQLSDRYGSFDSVFYTLGSDSSTQGGIINGRIPDTVITSTNYSIRVIADNPAVVSFADSITFNISQKPVAKAGSDTLICFGQTLHLGDSNSSATQYLWKPVAFMNDSTIKFPLVKPDTSVAYILTAQSNNCFAYDTVLVNVRKPLSFAPLHDIVFCKNDTLVLQPTVFGGDSLHRKLNIFKLPDTTIFATNDQLMRIRFVPDSSHTYRVTLSDGCSPSFSRTFNLRLRVPLNLTMSNDTLVCRGVPLQLSVNGWQSDVAAYHFNWSYLQNATQFISLTDSSFYKLISDSSRIFLLKSKYACVNKTDNHYVKIDVLPRLQLRLNADTAFCFGNNYSVTATAKGGDSLYYKFNWKNLNDSSTFIDSNYKSFTHLFTPLKTVTYQIQLTDGCTIPIDSSKVKITVYPKIVAGFTINDSVQCINTNNFLFKDTSIADGTCNRIWNLGDATTNTNVSFNKSYSKTGAYNIQLKIMEQGNCSDSATHSIIVKQNPVKPLTELVPNILIKATISDNKYTWFLDTDSISNPYKGQTLYIHKNGTYYIKVDSTNGCSNSSDAIKVNLFSGAQVLVYPNPNDGNFIIDFIDISGLKNVEVYDMLKKFITSFSTYDNRIEVNANHILAGGMYLLRVETSGGTFVEKVVIE
jgi:Secretion system C-terminal sorting domain